MTVMPPPSTPPVDHHSATDTGRLRETLSARARHILFERHLDDAIATDLPFMTLIDQAHLVMLVRQNLLRRNEAKLLLEAIDQLRTSGFAALKERPAPRGLYLLYESYLIEQLGSIGGKLQFGRSRNDLNATMHAMKLRGRLFTTILHCLQLQSVLLRGARKYLSIAMPIYTHYQAAQPVTLGHYFAGISVAFDRDIASLLACLKALSLCPLGAGAVAGTTVSIDPSLTAELLGFDHPSAHATDAVASRDVALRVLSALAIAGTTLSRLAHDLQLWTTQEFGLLTLPDHLVGSSSMMPQKRNAYIFEHIKGMSSAAAGSFTAALQAAHATPFANSIAVGTESVSFLWDALDRMDDAFVLTSLMVGGVSPRADRMNAVLRSGYTAATALADWLVAHRGMDFRQAHHDVGALVRAAIESGIHDLSDAVKTLRPDWVSGGALDHTDPERVAQAASFGGGPARNITASLISDVRSKNLDHYRTLRQHRTRWRRAAKTLSTAVAELTCVTPGLGPGVYE